MEREQTALRWGDGRRAAPDYAREQILDAALRCYQKYTFQEASMGQIAREAKVSRTTIYRHFQNREEVILGVVARELYAMIGMLGEQIPANISFAEFVVETLVVVEERLRRSPVFELLLRETAIFLSRVESYASEVIGIAAMYFGPPFEAARAAGELREGIEFDEFMDWVSHVGASFIMMSSASRDSSDGFRSMLWRYLMPSIVREHALPADKRA